MKRIGLTGGVGAGKSEVAAILLKEGIPVIDLDSVGRQLLEEEEVIQKIAALFGPSVLVGGKINRAEMRKVIFPDSDKRKKLEGLLHPLIFSHLETLTKGLEKAGKKIVVCEAPLLIETGFYKKLDKLIVVLAPRELMKKRLMQRDSIPEDLTEQIIQAQTTDAEREKVADFVIRNNGSKVKLKEDILAIIPLL